MTGLPSERAPLIFVCTTCVRGAIEVDGGDSVGRRLAAALAAAGTTVGLAVREVACLSGCPSPCNVALRGRRRWSYRFSRCSPDDVELLLAAAQAYRHAPRGELHAASLPAGLRAKLSACAPPPA